MAKRYDVLYVQSVDIRNGELVKLEKSRWNRIGAAFVNKDGSINVKFDGGQFAMGDVQLRLHVDKEERGERFE